MAAEFDPYYEWLGIAPKDQPPHAYRLLGIDLYEGDPRVIDSAAEQRMLLLRSRQTGKNAAHSQKLLNEVSAAQRLLLDPAKKAALDAELKAKLAPPKPKAAKPVAKMAQATPLAEQPIQATLASNDLFANLPSTEANASPLKVTSPKKPSSDKTMLYVAAAGMGALVVFGIAGVLLLPAAKPKPQPSSPPIAQTPIEPMKPAEMKILPPPPVMKVPGPLGGNKSTEKKTVETKPENSFTVSQVKSSNEATLPRAVGPGEWVDLLEWNEGFDWSWRGRNWNENLEGPATKNSISLKPTRFNMYPLPATIQGDYDMEIEFTRHAGSEGMGFFFPVGIHNMYFESGGVAGTRSGVQWIKSQSIDTNPTLRRPSVISNGVRHKIAVRVRQNGEQARFEIDWDDTKNYITWEGSHSDLTNVDRGNYQLSLVQHLWLHNWENRLEFQKIRVKMLSGEIRRDSILSADRAADLKQGFMRLVGEKPLSTQVGAGTGFLINQVPVLLGPAECERAWPLVTKNFSVCSDFYTAHAPSNLKCPIPQNAKSFTAFGSNNVSRTTKFIVLLDGKSVYESPVTELAPVKIEIPTNAKELELVVDMVGDQGRDQTYWCYPRFHKIPTQELADDMLTGDTSSANPPFTIASNTVGTARLARNEPLFNSPPLEPRDMRPCHEFFFAHAPSTATFTVPPDMTRFTAVGYSVRSGSVKFEVWSEGKRLFESPKAGIVPVDVALPPNTKTIELRVDQMGDEASDWSMWCYPRFSNEKYTGEDAPVLAQSTVTTRVVGPGQWVDLLEWTAGANWGAMPQSHDWNAYLESPPTREGITLRNMKDARFPLAAIIDGNYEMETEFTRYDSQDGVGIRFPLSNQFPQLGLSHFGGKAAGISYIGGKPLIDDNGTTRRPSILENNVRHKLRLVVVRKGDRAEIRVDLDDQPNYIRWEGAYSDLTHMANSPVENINMLNHIWLTAWESRVTFHSVRVKMLTGEIRRDTITPADREADLKRGMLRLVGEKPLELNAGGDSFAVNQMSPNPNSLNLAQSWPLVSPKPEFCREYYGSHAHAKLNCPVPKNAKSFTVMAINSSGSHVRFQAKVNGTVVYNSGVTTHEKIKFDLPANATELELEADPAGTHILDHVYWCYPRFHSVPLEKVSSAMIHDPEYKSVLLFEISSHTVGHATLTHNKPIEARYTSGPLEWSSMIPCHEYIFAHAATSVKYAIPPGMARFSAIAYNVRSHDVRYEVVVDGKTLFEVPKAGLAPIEVSLPPESKILELKTHHLGDLNFDHSMWCYPRLYSADYKEEEPLIAMVQPEEPKSVASVRDPQQPRGLGDLLNKPESPDKTATLIKRMQTAITTHEKAMDDANKKMLKAFETALGKVRKDKTVSADELIQLVKRLEVEQEAFKKAGYVPFSAPMRTYLPSYLELVNVADEKLKEAFDRQIAAALKTSKEDEAAVFTAERDRMLAPRVIAKWHNEWTMYANGKMQWDAMVIWSGSWVLKNNGFVVAWKHPDGVTNVDTCTLSTQGDSFEGLTHTGARFSKTWKPPTTK